MSSGTGIPGSDLEVSGAKAEVRKESVRGLGRYSAAVILGTPCEGSVHLEEESVPKRHAGKTATCLGPQSLRPCTHCHSHCRPAGPWLETAWLAPSAGGRREPDPGAPDMAGMPTAKSLHGERPAFPPAEAHRRAVSIWCQQGMEMQECGSEREEGSSLSGCLSKA